MAVASVMQCGAATRYVFVVTDRVVLSCGSRRLREKGCVERQSLTNIHEQLCHFNLMEEQFV